MKQATAILATHAEDMHKREICVYLLIVGCRDCSGVFFTIRELPTDIPFQIHVQILDIDVPCETF